MLFRKLSLSIGPGEACHITGANGSGKTTLIRTLAGLSTPYAGEAACTGRVGLLEERTGLDPDLPEIVADQRATKQIITNLLSNAIRYTPEGGQVVISTRYLTDGSVTLHIRDTGVGMTREEIDGALRPFKQVSADDELRAAGTGLGLPSSA